MPASTTKLQFADALERAKTRIVGEFTGSNYEAVIELACKLMVKYTREEAKL